MSMTIEVRGLSVTSAWAAIRSRRGVLARGWTEHGGTLAYANTLTGTELGSVSDSATDTSVRVEVAVARPPWYGVEVVAALDDLCAAAGVEWDAGPVLDEWQRQNEAAVAIEEDLGIARWEASEADARRWYEWQMSQPERCDYLAPFSPNLLWLLDPRHPRSRARLTFAWAPGAAYLPRVDSVVVRHEGALRLVRWEGLSAAAGHLMEPVQGGGNGECYLIDIHDDEAAADAVWALLAAGAGGVVDPSLTAVDGGHAVRRARRAAPLLS